MYLDIAIIGMAGRFPDAKTLHEFYENLKTGRDSIRPFSIARKESTSLDAAKEYNPIGYLDDIDHFDHPFFNISMGEAMHMDPHQRFVLEVVHEAIENAGYNMDAFNGSNASVFIGDTNQQYVRLASKYDPLFITGNSNATTAGRVARFFNLTGNALMVDTACSSSLVALHLACRDIANGESDYAFVCGANIILFPGETAGSGDIFSVRSADGRTKAFAAGANGTGAGEAVACVILKPLEKAMQDGDLIHAVIKSTAVNQDAQRSGNLTAPSSIAQAELIKKAWIAAGIDPQTISYIETHGTGTPIGDPIEFEGITKAFAEYTGQKQFCAISSVKTNIGHTDSAAGISSLVKAVLSLKYKEMFPSIHFSEPNPLIDFINSPLYINTFNNHWHADINSKRRAGVSSFGISGTNCHTILEEAPDFEPENRLQEINSGSYLFTFSSLTRDGLIRNMKVMKEFLQYHHTLPAQVSYTLNTGRKHYPFRAGITAASIEELSTKIADFADGNYTAPALPVLWFVFSGDMVVSPQDTAWMVNKYDLFSREYDHCLRLSDHFVVNGSARENLERFIFQYCLYRLIESVIDISDKKVMGSGTGKILIRVLKGELALRDALFQVANYQAVAQNNLAQRVQEFISSNQNQAGIAIIEVGSNGEIGAAFNALKEGDGLSIYKIVDENADLPMLQFIGDMYMAGQTINWHNLYDRGKYRKTELPGYQFTPTRCWILEKGKIADIYADKTTRSGNEEEALPYYYNSGWTETENKVAHAWQQVLYTDELSVTDNFFQLGGHSLLAVRVMNILGKEFGTVFEFRHLLEYATIEKLAAFIDQGAVNNNSNVYIPISCVLPQAHYELSHAQKRLWILEQIAEVHDAYNVPLVCHVHGNLNFEAFNRAFEQLIVRHESLRTGFLNINGEPRQYILEPSQTGFSIVYKDLRKEENKQDCLQQIVRENSAQPFDLESAPLVRGVLIQIEDNVFVLVLTIHHIVVDGWSMAIIINEMLALYNEEVQGKKHNLPAPVIQYKDFAAWHNNLIKDNSAGEHKQYWLNHLGGELPYTDFLPDKPRPAIKSYEGALLSYEIEREASQRFLWFSQDNNATLFMAFVSVIKALAYRYTGNEDIIIGTTVAGREHPDLEKQVGYFVNNLALRTPVKGTDSFESLLKKVAETTLNAYRHAIYPFDKLVTELSIPRDTGRSPVFDILVEYNDMTWGNDESAGIGGVIIKPFDSGYVTSKYDLTFRCYGGEKLRIDIEYNTALFSSDRIVQLMSHLVNLLHMAGTHSDLPINELDYLSAEEKQQLLSFNSSRSNIVADDNCVLLFERQVMKTPHAIAVICEERTVTYAELNARANQLAHYLKQQYNAGPGTCIGIMQERSELVIIALLAISKSGAAYLPVDPAYPPERKKYMLEEAGVEILLTDVAQMMQLDFYPGAVFAVDVELPLLQTGTHNPDTALSGDDLAYIIYTSGSTGIPKGIQIEHRSLVNYIKWAVEYYLADGTCGHSAFFTTLCFDFTITGILCPLLTGNSIQVYPSSYEPDVVLRAIFDPSRPCNLVKLTPSHVTLLGRLDIGNTNIKKIIVGGEELTPAQVSVIRSIDPSITIVNEYGPTEATVGCIVKTIDASEKITIGRPISNMNVFVMDDNGNLCGVGIPGEICLQGTGVSRGYLNKPALTRERFIVGKFTDGVLYKTGDVGKWNGQGEVEYLGRKDSQIKIHGYRIEPGEIESCLQQHPEVEAAAVLSKKNVHGILQLTAYVSSGNALSGASIREHLRTQLPEYMIPAVFIMLKELPMTPNGKIDRKTLLTYTGTETENTAYVPASNELEEQLVLIWKSVLERDKIGVMDNFFEIGGDSLKTILIFHQIRKIHPGVKISKLFSYYTIAQQAVFIKNQLQPVPAIEDGHMQEIQF